MTKHERKLALEIITRYLGKPVYQFRLSQLRSGVKTLMDGETGPLIREEAAIRLRIMRQIIANEHR